MPLTGKPGAVAHVLQAGVQKLLAGETNNVAEVFSTSRKAGIAFDLLMEIRNKLLDAYSEVKQMRV